ncbi:MAG: FecR family protein [Tannerellaceae bacterium]
MKDNRHYTEEEQDYLLNHAVRTRGRIAQRDPLAAYARVESRLTKNCALWWSRRVVAVAACVIAVVGLSVSIAKYAVDAPVLVPQYVTLEANAGMRGYFTLPDSTQVYLNSGSTITYPVRFDGNERNVLLVGEAYFKVTRNEQQPFVVSTSNDQLRVKVYGTEFNVQAFKNESAVYTTLVEGSVALQYKNNTGTFTEHRLKPSERAIYSLSKHKVAVEQVNAEVEKAWIDGKLIFKDTPMPEVLRRLALHYNVKFEVADNSIYQHRFTGVFQGRPLSQVLNYITISSNIAYSIIDNREDDTLNLHHSVVKLTMKK